MVKARLDVSVLRLNWGAYWVDVLEGVAEITGDGVSS